MGARPQRVLRPHAARFGTKIPIEIHFLEGGIEMTIGRIFLAGMGFVLLLSASFVVADTEALRTLARITIDLNHYPSDEDKATLKTIIDSDDSSEEEAAIAMALSNMQHKVTAADAERLADIVADDLSDASARKLAGILLGIEHSPGEADKAALKALAGE
jgi:hypothetical protein